MANKNMHNNYEMKSCGVTIDVGEYADAIKTSKEHYDKGVATLLTEQLFSVNKTFCRHCGVPRDNPDNLFTGWKTIYNKRGIPVRKLCPVCAANRIKRGGSNEGSDGQDLHVLS